MIGINVGAIDVVIIIHTVIVPCETVKITITLLLIFGVFFTTPIVIATRQGSWSIVGITTLAKVMKGE